MPHEREGEGKKASVEVDGEAEGAGGGSTGGCDGQMCRRAVGVKWWGGRSRCGCRSVWLWRGMLGEK